MSERLGAAERAALERARAGVIAQRRGYFRRLADIAVLQELGIAVATGYRSTESLIADQDNVGHAEAKRLVAEAAELCPRTSLHGEPLPALLPATGAALSTGVIDPAHVKIIRETMRHLSGLMVPPPPDEWAGVEHTLAEKAQELPPHMLRVLARTFIDFYDPDGAAPPDGEDCRDEMRLLRRKDGSLVFKGQLHDPLDAEAAVEVFGVLAARAGADDDRSLETRQAHAFTDLVQDARGPRGLATDTHHETDAEPAEPESAAPEPTEDAPTGQAPPALLPAPRRAPNEPGWTERPGRALLTVTIDHRWLCQALAGTGGYGYPRLRTPRGRRHRAPLGLRRRHPPHGPRQQVRAPRRRPGPAHRP